jgi:hypothetical protein
MTIDPCEHERVKQRTRERVHADLVRLSGAKLDLARLIDEAGRLERAQWSGAGDAAMWPVGVENPFVLAQGAEQVCLVPDQRAVEQLVTARLDPAFHDRVQAGTWIPVRMVVMPASARMVSNRAGYCRRGQNDVPETASGVV